MTTIGGPGGAAIDQDAAVEALAELVPICSEMLALGLPKRFAITAMAEAVRYDGLRQLLKMWHEERDQQVRAEVVADIGELLEDLTIQGIVELPALRHRDVAPLVADIRAFKDALRRLVDERGGVGWLAEQSKIPQPSLSRFFNSPSLPQRGTLLKLREALAPEGNELLDGWLNR